MFRAHEAVLVSVLIDGSQLPVAEQAELMTERVRLPVSAQVEPYEQPLQLLVIVVPQGLLVVLRAQAVMSVSVPAFEPQLPTEQV